MMLDHQAVCGCGQLTCPELPSSISCLFESSHKFGAILGPPLNVQPFPIRSPSAIDCLGYQHHFESSS